MHRKWPKCEILRRSEVAQCGLRAAQGTPHTSRFHARFGFAGSQCGRGGARDQASCLATVLEVLLRAGFVASMPGTPEFCPRKDTPQVVHCDDGRISTRGKSLPIFSH